MKRLPRHYRLPLAAVALSAAIHASVIVGGGGSTTAATPSSPSFDATLAPAATLVDAAPAAAPKPAAPRAARKPRPISLPRPAEMLAQAPDPVGLPPLAEMPSLPELRADVSEKVALAAPVAPPAESPSPQRELTEPFPTGALPGRLSITYALTSAFADGRAVYEWERDGDEYVITGEAEAVGFFTLFLEGRVLQESRGRVTAEGLRPERFRERLPNANEEGLDFDWNAGKVTFARGTERNTSKLEGNTVDWLTMIFQLAHRPPKGEAPFDLRVFTQRRLYQFRLQVLGEEEIEIPIGRVRALHLRHVDEEKGELVDVWLGINQHYIPVKMRYPVARNRFTVEQTATRIRER
jgi:hypothetical protein